MAKDFLLCVGSYRHQLFHLLQLATGEEALLIWELAVRKSRNVVCLMIGYTQFADKGEESIGVWTVRFQDTEEILIALAETHLGGSHCIM